MRSVHVGGAGSVADRPRAVVAVPAAAAPWPFAGLPEPSPGRVKLFN
jgi:hypothetical protein